MGKPLVLVVEDDQRILDIYVKELEGVAEVIAVKSFNRAARAIAEHGEKIVAVTLDHNILLFEDDKAPATSVELIFRIRHECGDIPIFCASGAKDTIEILVSKGCLPGTKTDAHFKLREYLESLV